MYLFLTWCHAWLKELKKMFVMPVFQLTCNRRDDTITHGVLLASVWSRGPQQHTQVLSCTRVLSCARHVYYIYAHREKELGCGSFICSSSLILTPSGLVKEDVLDKI
jgi:hypothetical protein